MKIKIKHSPGEWMHVMRRSLMMLATGVAGTLWSAVLLVINVVLWTVSRVRSVIRRHPCASVVATFMVMLLVVAVTHMRMKVRLTTAEWQRDSLELRLDSIKTLTGATASYFRYQKYQSEK